MKVFNLLIDLVKEKIFLSHSKVFDENNNTIMKDDSILLVEKIKSETDLENQGKKEIEIQEIKNLKIVEKAESIKEELKEIKSPALEHTKNISESEKIEEKDNFNEPLIENKKGFENEKNLRKTSSTIMNDNDTQDDLSKRRNNKIQTLHVPQTANSNEQIISAAKKASILKQVKTK
jgi:hypothetical protein